MTKSTGWFGKHRTLRNIVIAVAVLLLLVVSVYAFRTSILTGLADYLIVDDRLEPADLIFLLNSEYNIRPFYASELYQQGLAPMVVIARSEDLPASQLGLVPNDTDVSIRVMESRGVPADKIIELPFPGGVTSTFDEAVALREYIEAHSDVHRIILVTSAFHTRRAKWIFGRELKGVPVMLEMAAAPYPNFDQTNWWRDEAGLITVNNEYVKLLFYFWKYR